MSEKLRTALMGAVAELDKIDGIASEVAALSRRVDELANRLEREWRPQITTEQAWATPAPSRWRRLLNGSWPLLDGNIYPPIRGRGPLGGYESYVRRSPPATE